MTTSKTLGRRSIMDLTGEQAAAIEHDIGLPMRRWSECPSDIDLAVKVLAALNGDGEERYRGMSLRDLGAMVDLEGSDPNP